MKLVRGPLCGLHNPRKYMKNPRKFVIGTPCGGSLSLLTAQAVWYDHGRQQFIFKQNWTSLRH